MRRTVLLCLALLGLAWFGIGGAELLWHGLPQMAAEWSTFAAVESDLRKRDILFPGWAECVEAVRKTVPPSADLVFLSDVDEEKYAYLRYLLHYEVYPLRHLHRLAYAQGQRPKFVLIYPGSPLGLRFDEYRQAYRGTRVLLLERRP
ncbi:MAG: hypothetical protein HY644_06290 [Acidobacteria bacterium]|nr:hypothetical protein [Acidobacteriota bacterium]